MASKIAVMLNGLKKWFPTTGTPAAIAVKEASGKITSITGGTLANEVMTQDQFDTNSTKMLPTTSPQFTQLGLGRTPNLLGLGSAVSVSNALFSACELIRSIAHASNDVGAINFFNGTTQVVSFAVRGDGAVDAGAFEIWTRPTGGSLTRRITCSSVGYFAIGSTQPLGKFESRDGAGTSQIVASYDATNALYIAVNSTGKATLSGAGTAKGLVLTDGIVAGTGTARGKVGGVLKTNVVATGNIGTGVDDLHSYTVPANTLSANGQLIEFNFVFTFSVGMSNKQVRVVFGAAVIYSSNVAVQNGGAIYVKGIITRTGATSQICCVEVSVTAAGVITAGLTYTAATETLSGAIILKATGESTGMSPANNDVVQNVSSINWRDAA